MSEQPNNVHDLFSGQELPVTQTEESMWAEEFIEEKVPEAQGYLDAMTTASTEADFVIHLRDLKRLVSSWPDSPS